MISIYLSIEMKSAYSILAKKMAGYSKASAAILKMAVAWRKA